MRIHTSILFTVCTIIVITVIATALWDDEQVPEPNLKNAARLIPKFEGGRVPRQAVELPDFNLVYAGFDPLLNNHIALSFTHSKF